MISLCPIAIAVGCVKCPMLKICPLKSLIGDYKKMGTIKQNKGKDDKK
jgi:hypothetical protein